MINNRLGAIFCEVNNPQKNYATTILQSIASLETTRNLFLNQNNNYINQTLMTNEFRNIVNNVYSSENGISAMNLINNLNNYALNQNQDLNQCNSPYTFLYYFLEMLDKEYNNAFQININLDQKFPSIENASNFFKQLYDTSNISIILKNYCFSIIMTNFCNACKTSKSKPVIKKTIDLNIDSYLQMNNSEPLTLNDCLKYYFTPKQVSVNCQNCDNSNLFQSRIILKTGPVLIINLMRNNYTGEKDSNFIIDFNLDLSPYKKDKNDGNNNYTLKSCLSYSNYGFFTDCLMKKDNSTGEWYRYMDKEVILNSESIFGFQPVLLFYEASNNQNNNNIIIQNNQNNIINQNNEKIFDVISNFPFINSIAFGEQIHNFDFNFEVNASIINNPESNLQMNSNFNNYQNQNNNFGNISSQPNEQIELINQNNINNMNDNINNQNINNNDNNNNNPNINLNPLHFYADDEDEEGETDVQYLNNENKENKEIVNNPLFNINQNPEKNQNSNFQNNDSNMNISMQSNLNQNMNQNANINNEINQDLNKNEMPNFNSLNSNQNNSNNMLQNNSSNENQEDFSSKNQNLQYNIMNNNFNNEMQQNLNVNMNINNEQDKQIQPNFQQNDFMSKNINIESNDMSSNMNPQEEEKIVVPQLSSISLPQEENKNDLNYNIKDPPQFSPNSFENQNKVVNEIPQNIMNPLNMNINFNQNNFNQIPQVNIPQNFPKEINEIKKEEPKQIEKELPKLEKKEEQIKIEKKIESNKLPESQPEKKKNIQERAKLFAGVIKQNPSLEGAAPKKKLNKDTIPKNEPKKEEKPKKIGGGKVNNIFKAMLEKKGIFGAPKPGAPIMGMPHGPGGMMMNNNANIGQGPTIEQNIDLKKNLDKIPVVKKKKKSKINFGDEI